MSWLLTAIRDMIAQRGVRLIILCPRSRRGAPGQCLLQDRYPPRDSQRARKVTSGSDVSVDIAHPCLQATRSERFPRFYPTRTHDRPRVHGFLIGYATNPQGPD